MTARLEAALAELAAALREEVGREAARGHAVPELLSIDRAAEACGIGRTALYGAIGRGEIRTVKVGRRRLVPSDAIAALVEPTRAADIPLPAARKERSTSAPTPPQG